MKETEANFQYTYKLNFEFDKDQGSSTTYRSANPVSAGAVFEHDDGLWYYVTEVRQMKSYVRLSLSKSGQSPQEARLLADQLSSEK